MNHSSEKNQKNSAKELIAILSEYIYRLRAIVNYQRERTPNISEQRWSLRKEVDFGENGEKAPLP